jgi:hypothetical protein
VTVLMQNQNNAAAPTSVNFTAEAYVSNNRLIDGNRTNNPGVFTAGTPAEGTSVNNHS